MQSKHLWDTIDIKWQALYKKLYVFKPTGLTRDHLWQHLFVTKHRANPWQEREYQGADRDEVYGRGYQEQRYMDAYRVITHPFCINVGVAIAGFNIDNLAAKRPIKDQGRQDLACSQVANQRRYLPDQRAASSGCQRRR